MPNLRNEMKFAIAFADVGGERLNELLGQYFCDGGESEDESGWSPAALSGSDAALEAIVDAVMGMVKENA